MKGNQIADQKEAELVQGMEEGERYQGETNEINEELNHEREMEKIAFKEQMKSQQ